MRQGIVVERTYSISNMNRYKDKKFLKRLDDLTENDGITILSRKINEVENSVTIKARFNFDQLDVCQASDFMSQYGVQFYPISDFTIISEIKGDLRKTIIEVYEVLENV
jgi:hypothetical protein